MSTSPYDLMQQAVDIVHTSEHPSNKIAATLSGHDVDGQSFAISKTNFWPESIQKTIGMDEKVGNSSGTIHAETACLLAAPCSHDSSLFITDPPCPNCVKNMAEAGVRALYIDHKGFDKDFALRRGEHFENMSMRICEKAGISVYKIFRKEQKLEPILEVASSYVPAIEKPPKVIPLNGMTDAELFRNLIEEESAAYKDSPFSLAIASGQTARNFMISAEPHPVIGYTSKTLESPDGKYSFLLQPVNRVLMTAARYGLRVDKKFLYSSRVPTAREQVNMMGAGIQEITLGRSDESRDESGLQALEQLQNAGILKILSLRGSREGRRGNL